MLIPTKLDSNTRRLKFVSETYQYKQIIQNPTRITPTSHTLIDLFYTNEPAKITHHGVVHIGISDHSLIMLSASTMPQNQRPKLWRRGNLKRLIQIPSL